MTLFTAPDTLNILELIIKYYFLKRLFRYFDFMQGVLRTHSKIYDEGFWENS